MALISAKVPRDIVSTLNVPLKTREFRNEIFDAKRRNYKHFYNYPLHQKIPEWSGHIVPIFLSPAEGYQVPWSLFGGLQAFYLKAVRRSDPNPMVSRKLFVFIV